MSLHNANKVLMGSVQSGHKEVINRVGTVAAGYVCHQKSDGTASVAKADGAKIGVSLGKDLSNTNRTAICSKGLGVPVVLKSGFNPTIGAVVSFDDTAGYATGDGTKTATAAVYKTGRIGGSGVDGGVAEDGSSVGAAYIDFPGGL